MSLLWRRKWSSKLVGTDFWQNETNIIFFRENLDSSTIYLLYFLFSRYFVAIKCGKPFIFRSLNQTGLNIAKELADKLMQDANQNRKQTHSTAQDKINILVNDMKLYEKGLKSFPFDQQPQLVKYLLKTFGGDVLAELCKYAASQCNLTVGDSLTVEQRNKIISDLPEEYMKPLKALNASLSDTNLDMFYQAVDVSLSACEMILKKADKKKDK